ncbi:MAG: ElyC/SanA/YdcF family protein [Pseudomonadota bacterium]
MKLTKILKVGCFATALSLGAVTMTIPAFAADPADAARIRELVDTGMQYYWSGGDIKKAEAEVFKGITLHGRYDVVEKAFAEASSLAPERLDLRYGIASAQILQKNLEGAVETYKSITRVDPRAFDAYAWLAAIAHIQGNEASYRNYLDAMAGIDRDLASLYRKRFNRADQIMATAPNADVPALSGNPTIVVLGYALAEDGSIREPLMQRLEVALKAARANPSARVMVTGGQPQSGVTEGDVMMRWLVEQGIDRDRIMVEDKSKDTVGNVLNIANLLERHTADQVILITSASHMRRAQTLLEDALWQYDLDAPVYPVIALDFATMDEASVVSEAERMVVYRDMLRVSGLWAFPGIQQ